jgi:PKD repeat protein
VADVNAYNPTTDAWAALTSLPAKRKSGVAASLGGSLYYSSGALTSTTYKGTPGGRANQPPVAAFTTETDEGDPLTIHLDASGSTDDDGSIAAYTWAFGDGETGSGATASHTYAAPGTYAVKLTVTDDAGATDSTEQQITLEIDNNPVPIASFTAARDETNPLTFHFDASASTDDSGIASYAWDFGDGEAGSGKTASRTYATPGIYTVRLTVTDDGGAIASTEEEVSVTGISDPVEGPPGTVKEYALQPNYPNPFRGQTTVSYAIPTPSQVSITVFDALGRRVAVLVDGFQQIGRHEVVFDGSGLPNGMYFCRMRAGDFTQTQRMALTR